MSKTTVAIVKEFIKEDGLRASQSECSCVKIHGECKWAQQMSRTFRALRGATQFKTDRKKIRQFLRNKVCSSGKPKKVLCCSPERDIFRKVNIDLAESTTEIPTLDKPRDISSLLTNIELNHENPVSTSTGLSVND